MVRLFLTAATAWIVGLAYTSIALHWSWRDALSCATTFSVLLLLAPFIPRG